MQVIAKTESEIIADKLSKRKIWILPQPKSVQLNRGSIDLSECSDVKPVGSLNKNPKLFTQMKSALMTSTGLNFNPESDASNTTCVHLGIFTDGEVGGAIDGITDADLQGLGDQGYVIHIDRKNVNIAAQNTAGLFYGIQTLGQITAGRTSLPAMHLRDWPSMQYRGVQYDVSRGQMPTIECLKNLADTLAVKSKANVLELYIEDTFKWRKYPDISPVEGITPKEGRQLSDYASQRMMEVHPMMQVLGHFAKIGDKPPYQKYMVRVPSGNTTVDVRKPEAVQFIKDLVDEICTAFPAKFLNVDVTEIDDEGYYISGTKKEDLPGLLMKYMIELSNATQKHGTRLMVAQCQLRAEGHLNGIGAQINNMPKEITVSSYYTAEFYGGWDYDFPLMQQKGVDFFVNPWIDSHSRIMPYIGHAADFSDITIKRGLQYGAIGSVTTDWGDSGHYQLPGVTIYPFMYHCVSAWTGGDVDRAYFDKAFSRIMFGIDSDAVSKAIVLAGNINGRPLKIRNAAGIVETPPYIGNSTLGWYFDEFFADPFTDPRIKQIADLEQMGQDILTAGNKSAKLLESAKEQASLNQDVLDQLLFAAKNYQAMGQKLLILNMYNDKSVSRLKVARELSDLADTYAAMKDEFRRLWLKDCKDAGTFAYLTGRFDQTIIPCRKMADELRKGNK
ncbi:MAG: glycoside hydrolase family 20 zincin-like fold domain-containing protein [Armatimonadota bacterium]